MLSVKFVINFNMMNMNKITLFLLFALPIMSLSAQSEKTVRKHKISQRVEKIIDHEDGLTDKRISVEQYFDREGRLLEFKDLTKEGKVKEWFKYTYNADGDMLTEITLDSKGNVEEKVVYEYLNGLRVKKNYYDAKDRLVKEKFYEYEYFE